jgi:hypothetical protein
VNQTVSNALHTGQNTITSLDKRLSSATIAWGTSLFSIADIDM